MKEKAALTLVVQPQDYFRELVTQALEKQKISTQPETEVYLVNILNQFMLTDQLYEASSSESQSLALLVKKALEEPKIHAQKALFRRIGDIALYMGGFFQDSLNRKLVDIEYYIAMGGAAYQQVAHRMTEEMMRLLYLELSERFSEFIEVFAEVSDRTSHKTEKDLLRLYEVWIQTRSERAAKTLQQAGIIPNLTLKKDWQ